MELRPTTAPGRRYLGIDLGTSSVKAVLIDSDANLLADAQVHYDVSRPRAGWAEQNPEAWWAATAEAIRQVIGAAPGALAGVGLSGQMHGLVLVDASGTPLRPAIIWSDSRSLGQVDAWSHALDPAQIEHRSGFPIATGMTGTSLTWVRDHEPEVYAAARTVLLPKDYIRFRLTGELATEPTDAGGSLLFDIRSGAPLHTVFERVGLREELLPPIVPSLSVAGAVNAEAAAQTGLPTGTPVAAGGGDQSMAALALGLDDPGRAAVAISSGGTVFKRTSHPLDHTHGLHVLPHAIPSQWLAMGVVLSAGLSIDWLARRMFGGAASPAEITSLMTRASGVVPGAEGLLFSSQLGGRRTPSADAGVRGSLVGLGYRHGQEHITRAMIEGVCFALADSLRAMDSAEEPVREIVISGGAARFAVWQQTLSDVTGLPVRVSLDIEHSAIGAGMAAARAVGSPVTVGRDARLGPTVLPEASAVGVYRDLGEELAAIERAIVESRRTTR
jgi:xylulokinase